MGKLPQNVADALSRVHMMVDSESEWADIDIADWQTIRAHLLSQEAEIERLTRENETMRRALETLDAIGHKRAELAESRLAVADALLSRCFVQIGELTKGLDPHDPIYVELQQLGLDWTQHSMRIPPHLSENPYDRA